MNGLLITHRCIVVCVLVALCSCSGTREQQFETDRSLYYPLAVFSTKSIPKHTSEAYTKDIKTGHSAQCLVGTAVYTFGLLSPFCAPLLIVDGVAAAEINERKNNMALKIESLKPEMEKLANHAVIRSYALEYLLEQGADTHEIMEDSLPSDSDEATKILYKQGYPMALELSLLLLEYSDYKDTFCITMLLQGRTIRTNDNQQIAIEKTITRSCNPLHVWLEDGVLENEVSKLYANSSRYILDNILFKYKKSEQDGTALSAIEPKILVEKRWYMKCNWEMEPCYSKLFGFVVLGKPEQLKDFRSLSELRFTEVDLKQRFEWSKISGPGITDARYDFRIYRGRPYVLSETTTRHINDAGHILLEEIVYSRDNLIDTSHEPDITLEPCSWYFWTVRAEFQLYGNPRVTEWSMFTNPVHGKQSYFPIHTPASEDNPECWSQKVD